MRVLTVSMRSIRFLWAAVVMLLALAPTATIRAGNLEQGDFIQHSEWVFLGRMVDRESYFSQDGRFILTRYLFHVERTLKGEHQGLAEIIEYGGTVGEQTLYVSHGASYREGAQYILFAHRDSRSRLRTLGGWEGSLEVLRGPQNQPLLRLFRNHPLNPWFAGRGSGLIPLEDALELVSERLGGRYEPR